MNRTARIMMDSQNYYESNKKRIWFIGAVVLMLVILFSVGFISKTVTAQRDTERTKRIASVEIRKGDTLWSIASDYISDEYDDMNDYINEIKDTNGMVSDEIHTGNFIIVPYYADASN
jgi:LysM repeat protein